MQSLTKQYWPIPVELVLLQYLKHRFLLCHKPCIHTNLYSARNHENESDVLRHKSVAFSLRSVIAVHCIFLQVVKQNLCSGTAHCTAGIFVLIQVHVEFRDPASLRALTWALLKDDFDIDISVPLDRLIPTVPLRLNYILWLEDIFTSAAESPLHGIDIGKRISLFSSI